MQRFIREVEIWRSIGKHPNVLPLIDSQLHALTGEMCLISPLAERDLRSWCRDHPEEERNLQRYKFVRFHLFPLVIYVQKLQVLDAAKGLHHLHSLSTPIIHGDLRAVRTSIVAFSVTLKYLSSRQMS